MKDFVFLLLLSIVSFGFQSALSAQDQMMAHADTDKMMKASTPAPTIIDLSQIEGEYTTQSLNLLPGDYIFRVTNESVDKDLGFYLQNTEGDQVKNSGLAELIGEGETQTTGIVTLTEGDYEYSCPLNPTPHYAISVGAPKVIELSQQPGEYLEGDVELTQGYYVFEVTNENVDKDLGFYLQDADGEQVEGSGLKALIGKGQTSRTQTVWLSPGTYQYSCPLNPTPHYTLTVK